jgi:hypothetical protein
VSSKKGKIGQQLYTNVVLFGQDWDGIGTLFLWRRVSLWLIPTGSKADRFQMVPKPKQKVAPLYRKINTLTNGLTDEEEPPAVVHEWHKSIAVHGIDTLTYRCLLRGLRTAASQPMSGK